MVKELIKHRYAVGTDVNFSPRDMKWGHWFQKSKVVECFYHYNKPYYLIESRFGTMTCGDEDLL